MTPPNSMMQSFTSNSFMELEADFNLAQNQIFRSSENEMYDLTNEESQEDANISLDNKMNSSQNTSDNEELHEGLKDFRRNRNDLYLDNLSICHRSFEYSQSRAHKAKKVIDITKQRERNSAAINCQWHVNFNKRKDATKIVCISFVNEHNHEMNPVIVQMAPCFRKLSKEMLEDIEFYTHSMKGLGAKIQYSLLSAKYPNKYIDKKDLYNAIQRFRIPSRDKLKTDATEALQQLIALKAKNSEWVVVPNIGDRNRLTVLFWMSPLQVSLWAQFHDIVITDNTCKTNCYEMPLCLFLIVDNNTCSRIIAQALLEDETQASFECLCEIDFERRWMRFVEFLRSFSKASRYALETLYPSLSHNSTLLHLVDAIQNRLNEEARYARINEQQNMNPSIGLSHVVTKYFPVIDSLIREYLTPHDQFPQEPENIVENGCLEDDYERHQIGLKSLLQTLERDIVVQIWIVVPQGLFQGHFTNYIVILADGTHLYTCLTLVSKGIVCCHFMKVLMKSHLARFHIFLISSRWYKTDKINENKNLIASLPPINLYESNQPSATNVTSHIIDFQYLSRFRVANVFTPALQKSVSEKTRWSKGHELTKKALNLTLRLNCDDEFNQMME
ncbi:14416_t:CDS:2, partial [Dentiscutata erythropus]